MPRAVSALRSVPARHSAIAENDVDTGIPLVPAELLNVTHGAMGLAMATRQGSTSAAEPKFGNTFGNKTVRNKPKQMQSDGAARTAHPD